VQPDSKSHLVRLIVGLCITLIAAVLLPAAALAARQDQAGPPATPAPAAGRSSYLQNCAPCHGETGKGDGVSAKGLSVQPAAFSDPAVLANLSPLEWFDVTRNGRMGRMMPPWANRLTDQQIWDTVGYAWTLHTSEAQVQMGRAVYEANCVSCHGSNGKGQPPQPDFTDFAFTSKVSQRQWAQSLQNGRNGMPAFGETLSETERSSALEFVRSLSMGPMFGSASMSGPGVISGTVTNGTTGAPVPGLRVELAIFDGTSLLDQRTTDTDAAGLYRFEGLPTDPNLIFASRTEYPTGVENNSEVAIFEAGQSKVNLPLAVYETSKDGSGVRADRAHYIVEFQDGMALIAEVVVFSLEGDRSYVGDGTGVLRFKLPPGAQDLSINDGELGGRYLATEDGFVDTLPLPPGQATRQVLYRYSLPYSDGKLDLQRSLAYPASNVNALIADQGQQVSSEGLINQGTRQTQNGNYYSLLGQNMPADQPILIRMSGLPSATAPGTSPGSSTASRVLLFALAAAAVAGAVLLALWPLLRRRAQVGVASEAVADRAGLIDALAELDSAYRSGEISESAYHDRRLSLKARLLDQVRKEGAQ
jgi:cytochrome c-type biogenesis protein CcmI